MAVAGQAIEQFGQLVGVLDIEASLRNAADHGGPTGEQVKDCPTVRIFAKVKSPLHGHSIALIAARLKRRAVAVSSARHPPLGAPRLPSSAADRHGLAGAQ